MIQNAFCEHIVKQKTQGKILVYKILLAALYATLLILPSFAIILFAPPFLIVPFLLIILTLVIVIFKLTWRLTCIEYEYQIIDDTIIFSKIYGRTKRKTFVEMPIRAFEVLGKYSDESEKYLSRLLVDKSLLFISSFTADNIYFGVFEDSGEKNIIFFEINESAKAKIARYGSIALRAYDREIR